MITTISDDVRAKVERITKNRFAEFMKLNVKMVETRIKLSLILLEWYAVARKENLKDWEFIRGFAELVGDRENAVWLLFGMGKLWNEIAYDLAEGTPKHKTTLDYFKKVVWGRLSHVIDLYNAGVIEASTERTLLLRFRNNEYVDVATLKSHVLSDIAGQFKVEIRGQHSSEFCLSQWKKAQAKADRWKEEYERAVMRETAARKRKLKSQKRKRQ